MKRISVAGLLLAGFLALAPGAIAGQAGAAQDFFSPAPRAIDQINADSLHFTLIPSGNRNVLFVWGHIAAGDSERFRTAVALARPIAEVRFFSGGGDLEEGLQIGRIVRAAGLATHIVGETKCMSACNFMFMGGVARWVDPDAEFVVHMFDKSMLPEAILLRLLQAKASTDRSVRLAQASMRPVGQTPRMGLAPALLDPHPAAAGSPAAQPGSQGSPNQAEQAAGCSKPSLKAMIGSLAQQIDDKDVLVAVASKVFALSKKFSDPGLCDEFVPMLNPLGQYMRQTEQDDAQTAAEIARFLVDMGLSLRFLTEFANIPNAQPRPLTRDELRDFRVVNTE